MMKPLNRLQNICFQGGALLILVGIILWIPHFTFAPYIFTVGACLFAVMQFLQKYEGRSFVVRRLRRQQLAGAVMLVVTGAMMIGSFFHLPYTTRNEWVVALLIAAVFELYTAFRIPVELKKEH